MGQAIIFKGLTVTNPLQTVNFPLTTASEYVSAFLTSAVSATTQETELTNFVQTLMDNGIWDKTAHCYPIVGGINEYFFDLKEVANQETYALWRTPAVGTTWDATRNAIDLSLPGNAVGVPMQFNNLSRTSSCFVASFKSRIDSGYILDTNYGSPAPSFLSALFTKRGGFRSPAWSTDHLDANLDNYTYAPNNNNIFISNFNSGTTTLKIAQNQPTLILGGTGTTNANTDVQVAVGGSFLAEQIAPAPATLNGTFNFFMAFNSFLSDNEMDIVAQAIYTFNEALGRHIDFD